jgi:hypothetical protein
LLGYLDAQDTEFLNKMAVKAEKQIVEMQAQQS